MSSKATNMTPTQQLANAAATVYTVPANTLGVIRHIHVQNPSALPVTFTMSLGADAAGKRIYDAYSIPAAAAGQPASVLDVFCYYVLPAGTTVQAFAGTAATLTFTMDGQELTAG